MKKWILYVLIIVANGEMNQSASWSGNSYSVYTMHMKFGAWNYEERRSIFTHPDPQKLLKENAGKGQKILGAAGEPGYRERVDFGEVIGCFVNDKTKEKIPTTMGIIHYSKKGAHIVPAKPKQ